MSNYLTDNTSAAELRETTTSAATSQEVKPYEFTKAPVKFTNAVEAGQDFISKESEENFYKKVFRAKSI